MGQDVALMAQQGVERDRVEKAGADQSRDAA